MERVVDARIPGDRIPLGDPRWYTHCQWYGESVKEHETAYSAGQYHSERDPNGHQCYDIMRQQKLAKRNAKEHGKR